MRPISTAHQLTPEVKTTLYTIPTSYHALWNLSYIVNNTGNNKGITVIWYDASEDTEYNIIYNYILSPSQFIKFDGGSYVVLEEGDEVRATSEAASNMTVVNTFELRRNKG